MKNTQTNISILIAHLREIMAEKGDLPVYVANDMGRCSHFDLEHLDLAHTLPPISANRGVAYVERYGSEKANALVIEVWKK